MPLGSPPKNKYCGLMLLIANSPVGSIIMTSGLNCWPPIVVMVPPKVAASCVAQGLRFVFRHPQAASSFRSACAQGKVVVALVWGSV